MRENLTSGSMRGSRGGPLGSYGLAVRPSTRKVEKWLAVTCGAWEQTNPVLYSTQYLNAAWPGQLSISQS